MNVADLQIKAHDAAGALVTAIYSKYPPHYAVYRTDERVRIQFADDDGQAKQQRDAIAPLNPICGEINGMINGWRFSQRAAPASAAKRYDRRVADALTNALGGDVAGAQTLLAAIKDDLIAERTAWARVQYLCVTSATSAIIAGAAWQLIGFPLAASVWPVSFALAGGVAGAFFSTAVALRTRTVLTDLHWQTNAADAVLRIIVGAISAVVLISLARLNAINLSMGDVKISGDGANAWLNALVLAFIAGFSERLIPDLLDKSSLGGGAAARAAPPVAAKPATPPPPASVTLVADAAKLVEDGLTAHAAETPKP